MSAKSLFEKVWDRHIVVPESAETPAILYIDLHLVHEVTSPQAFSLLRDAGLKVRRPDLTLSTMDHSTPTIPCRIAAGTQGGQRAGRLPADPADGAQLRGFRP